MLGWGSVEDTICCILKNYPNVTAINKERLKVPTPEWVPSLLESLHPPDHPEITVWILLANLLPR